MAFKLTNPPFPKKPKRSKKVKELEYQVDPNVFASDPYSTTSTSRSVTDKKYDSGSGKVAGLESKLTYNPSTGEYTRTQVESSSAMQKRVSWEYGGETYYGDLIPSMETKTHRYARTHNGKIKSLPKNKK